MKKILYLSILFLSILMLASCDKVDTPKLNQKYDDYDLYLESSFSIVPWVYIIAENSFLTKERKTTIKNDLDKIVVRLDKIFNVQDRRDGFKTELMMVNENAGKNPVVVSPEVIEVLKIAQEASELSICEKCDGKPLFDPTIAPVWDLWNFTYNYYDRMDDNKTNPPSSQLIDSKLPLVDYKKIIINEEDSTVLLETEGMKLDLGGIVKGYAADKVKEYLVNIGIKKAIIDIGGNIHTIGLGKDSNEKDRLWRMGIQTPYYDIFFDDLPQFIGIYNIDDQTIVSSGTYERFIRDENGNDYHHILDPRSGYPINNSVVSTTIITNNSTWADALSTTIFALGLSEGMKKVEELPNVEAVFIVKNGANYEVYISSGAEQYFTYKDEIDAYNYTYKGVYKGE